MGKRSTVSDRKKYIQPGKATHLHYTTTARGKRYVASASRARRGRRPSRRPRLSKAVVVAVAAVALVIGSASAWYFLLRDVAISVNGEQVVARVNAPLAEVLEEHDYFGAVPGRLLSVGGNVIEERGGEPCAVSRQGEQLAPEQVEGARIQEGDVFTVADGTDTEEASTEETQEIAPGIHRETGGAIQFVSQWGKAGSKRVKTGEVSGETAEEVLEEPQDMVVSSVNPRPSSGKYVALTFDDGPSSYTPQILEILKEKGVRATFFNLGSQAQSNPSGSRAIVEAGQELASHTMAHRNLPTVDRDTLRSEISTAADALSEASGTHPQMIRAPYGAFGDTEWARSGDLISCNVLWNVDTCDWERPGADAIRAEAVNSAFNGAIILMHDGGGNREQTVAALPGIIDDLRAKGYEFVTVSELMSMDDRIPEDVANGTVSMPEEAVLPSV